MGSGIVFISSAYKGETLETEQVHVAIARAMCLLAHKKGMIPFASHLLYTQFLNDEDVAHREIGIWCGRQMLMKCDYIMYYEPHLATSRGVKADVELSNTLKKPIVAVKEEDLTEILSQVRPSRVFEIA